MKHNWGAFLLTSALVFAPGLRAQDIKLLDYVATPSKAWTSKTPSSTMRLAEYSASKQGVTPPVDVVVYFFGPGGQGGNVDANLARWKGQFSNPSGGAIYEKVTRDSTAKFPLTIAEYRGTYARATGMGSSAADARPNHTLIAVVAETPRGSLFFQMYGPSAAVAGERDAFVTFAKSLRPN